MRPNNPFQRQVPDRDDAHRTKGDSVEDTIKMDKVQIERKTFVFTLKENPRGRFLRITEDLHGRRNSIIIPAPGLEDFKKLFALMQQVSEAVPSKDIPGPPQGLV